jgi:hypothetical protein
MAAVCLQLATMAAMEKQSNHFDYYSQWSSSADSPSSHHHIRLGEGLPNLFAVDILVFGCLSAVAGFVQGEYR